MSNTQSTINGLLLLSEMEKTARVFGAQVPNTVSSPHPAITNERRRRDYEKYLRAKASEGATGIGMGALGGAALGAGIGALGTAMSRSGKYTLPVAVGSGLGGILGALVASEDQATVRNAAEVLARSKTDRNAIPDAMSEGLASQFARDREMQSRRDLHTNMALANAVFGRPSYGYYY